MPMFRSGSIKSTLSMMHRRSTKYQKYLNFSNVMLIIISTILIFTSAVLMKFYMIDKLDFWSVYFVIVPNLMICLGVYTFLVSIFGFILSGFEHRGLIALYAVLLAGAFLVQLVSIFTAMELRTTVAQGTISPVNVNDDLINYGTDAAITAKWDIMQHEMHCCGGNNYNVGYKDYQNTPMGHNNSVPDSCCLEQRKNCGMNLFSKSDADVRNTIFTNGCLTILKSRLNDDVIPMMIIYACVGVILAIMELITVVLAAAHVAQISRRRQHEEDNQLWRHGNAAMEPNDEALALNNETMC